MTIQYRYFRVSNRIIVLARQVDKVSTQIFWGMSIFAPQDGEQIKFDKTLGKKIAVGRLEAYRDLGRNMGKTAGVLKMEDGYSPIETIIKRLIQDDPRIGVRKTIASFWPTKRISEPKPRGMKENRMSSSVQS